MSILTSDAYSTFQTGIKQYHQTTWRGKLFRVQVANLHYTQKIALEREEKQKEEEALKAKKEAEEKKIASPSPAKPLSLKIRTKDGKEVREILIIK